MLLEGRKKVSKTSKSDLENQEKEIFSFFHSSPSHPISVLNRLCFPHHNVQLFTSQNEVIMIDLPSQATSQSIKTIKLQTSNPYTAIMLCLCIIPHYLIFGIWQSVHSLLSGMIQSQSHGVMESWSHGVMES